MDLVSFLLGLLPVVTVGFVCVVAFRRRRRDRSSGSSPLVVNPYTLAMEPDADARGSLPVVQPAPQNTTGQKLWESGAGRPTAPYRAVPRQVPPQLREPLMNDAERARSAVVRQRFAEFVATIAPRTSYAELSRAACRARRGCSAGCGR